MKKFIKIIMVIVLLSTFSVNSFAIQKANDVNDYKKQEEMIKKRNDDKIKEFVSKDDIKFIKELIKFKKKHPELTTEEIRNIVFYQTGNEEVQMLLGESSGYWNSLTPSEQNLVIFFPSEAILVNACKSETDSITNSRHPNWEDGDEGNAFRHALWNALMSQAIGKSLAEAFADAHEEVINPNTQTEYTDSELENVHWNGFNGLEHKEMDLHNNQKGRDCYKWYDFFTSSNTFANRVQTKIDDGEMVILITD
jgi:hypothetical protein